MPVERPKTTRRATGFIVAIALATAGIAGCGSDEPRSPAEVRKAKVEARLRQSFSGAQTRCILGRLDESTIRGLAGTNPDRSPSADLGRTAAADYDDALIVCVTDPSGSSGTSSTTTTTTAATPSGN